MKILMINSVCGIRSTGRICTDLATTLEAEGHVVKIGYGRENVPEKYERFAIRIGTKKDVILHGLKARLIDADGQGSVQATKKFLKWVRLYDPDIIHLHNLHGYYINFPELFQYIIENNKRVIWTLHDMWAFTGHGCICDGLGCDKWKTGCGHCIAKKGYPRTIIDRSSYNYKKKKACFTAALDLTLITPSKWLANLAKMSYFKDNVIDVIPNGIDLEQFKYIDSDFRDKHDLREKIVILGCSTWWGKGKGLYDFYRLSELLDDRFKIILVGLNDEQINGCPDKIMGIKRTDSVQELAKLYSTADVFFNPTYIDNYPTVNLEALACGTPVITYETGGSAECLDGKNGKMFKQGDIEGVANYLMTQYAKTSFCISNTDMLSKETTCKRYLQIFNI